MKRLHQYLGLLMLFPFIAWAITGVFFFLKPGYKTAYESLPIKTYELKQTSQLDNKEGMLEVRWLHSILGHHLLAKSEQGWQQLNPKTLRVEVLPNKKKISQLINHAIQINPNRYGKIKSIDGTEIEMSTGVKISLNWSQMNLYQTGSDTMFINNMYKIHYLQWTGIQSIDKVLGIVGLGLMLVLAFLGVLVMFRRKEVTPPV